MGSRWQLRVPRSEGEPVCDPVRGVIHNMHRIKPPHPLLPPPVFDREGWVDNQRNTP